MKKIYLLLCVCFTLLNVNAQKSLSNEYNYTISKPFEVIDGAKNYFASGNIMMAIKEDRKNIYIQKFDTNSLTEISREEYAKKDFLPDNAYPEGIVQLKGKCIYFYSSWSGKKTKHERLYFFEIDFTSGKIIEGEHKKIIDHEGYLAKSYFGFISTMGIPIMGYGSMFGGKKFDILPSMDSTKVLIEYRKKPTVKRDTKSTDVIGFYVFDADLNSLWNKDFKMPYTERRMDLLDYAIDTKGDGYMLAKIFKDDSNKDKKKKKDKNANYHLELFKLNKDNADIKKTRIELDNSFINELKLFESEKGFMYLAGYYNNGLRGKVNKGHLFGKEEKKKNADGVVLFKFSLDGELVSKDSHEIPNEIINQYISDRSADRNEKRDDKEGLEFENLYLDNLILNSDGSVLLVGEQFRLIEKRTTKRVYYVYLYRNILVSKINADGSLAWMAKVPKNQVGKNGKGGMSYTYLHSKGNHHLIFLDNVKNMDLPLNEFPYKHSDGQGGYLTSYKINDASGSVSKGSVFDSRNLDNDTKAHQFNTNRILKTSEDTFIVEVYKKKKEDVLIKVEIK